MIFFRSNTDKVRTECPELLNMYLGSHAPPPVWIVGSGPSLNSESAKIIRSTNAPVMAMNFSGRGDDGEPPLITPDLWTAFDPSPRFHGSIFMNPLVKKFINGGRTMDIVPGTALKACDMPNMYFYDLENRPYSEFFTEEGVGILHCLDSLILALDICFRLGFRTFYLVGTDLRISPSKEQRELCESKGIRFVSDISWEMLDPKYGQAPNKEQTDKVTTDILRHLLLELVRKGAADNVTKAATLLESCNAREDQYRFTERKPAMAAATCDEHYWRTIQYLRLAKKNMIQKGVKLINCTEGSRLAPFFGYNSVEDSAKEISQLYPDPSSEPTTGRYTGEVNDVSSYLPYHRDIENYNYSKIKHRKKGGCDGCGGKAKKDENAPPEEPMELDADVQRRKIMEKAKEQVINQDVQINEEG